MSAATLAQHLLTGVSLGGSYALIAVGYTMVYGILRLINFAHGDLFMMSGYFMIFAMSVFPWQISIPIVLVATVGLGVGIEGGLCTASQCAAYVHHDFRHRRQLSSGKPGDLSVHGYSQGISGNSVPEKIYTFGNITTSLVTIITPILTIVLVFLLVQMINHTKIGMAMRAVSKDTEASRLMGIKVNTTITTTFVIGSLLAGIGSILYFTDRMTVYPYSGSLPGLKCFVAAVLGGIGSIPGAVIGGFIIGISETMLIAFGYSTFSDAFTFLLLIIILLIRPTGLFGEAASDKV